MADFKKLMAMKNNKTNQSVTDEINNVTENRDYEAYDEEKKECDDEAVIENSATSDFEQSFVNTQDNKNERQPETKKARAIMLIKEHNRYMRIKIKKNGMTVDKYISDLIENAMKNPAILHGEELFDYSYRRYSDKKERSTASISAQHLSFIENEATEAGITMTDYFNYLVEQDMKN